MTRQTWIIAALVTLAVVALWWVFLMSPQREELAQVEADIAAAEAQSIALEGQIAGLEELRTEVAEIEAGISTLRQVVPDDPALPPALRQLQAAADDAGVRIAALSTSRPTASDRTPEAEGGPRLYEMPIALEAEGSYFQIVDFMRRIEDPLITARGVTIDSAAINPTDHPMLALSLSGRMYAVLEEVVVDDSLEQDAAPAATDEEGDAEGSTEATTTDDATGESAETQENV